MPHFISFLFCFFPSFTFIVVYLLGAEVPYNVGFGALSFDNAATTSGINAKTPNTTEDRRNIRQLAIDTVKAPKINVKIQPITTYFMIIFFIKKPPKMISLSSNKIFSNYKLGVIMRYNHIKIPGQNYLSSWIDFKKSRIDVQK